MSFVAPTQDQVFEALMSLHPRGRAFQNNELFGDGPGDSPFRQFWYGVAGVLQVFEAKMVAMLAEFSCTTTTENADLWVDDYTDDCGLAAYDLCLKVQESGGGQDLSFYQTIATTLGFTATFEWLKGTNVDYPGVVSSLLVKVDTASSPSFALAPVGELVVGESSLGGIGTDLLECILQHIVPAHIALIFVLT